MKVVRIVCCLYLLLMGLVATYQPSIALAQEGAPTEEKLELKATYPTLEDTAPGASFAFDVTLNYQGSKARVFELAATGPKDWSVVINPGYSEQKIVLRSITLEPNKAYPDMIKVVASPPYGLMPELKEYKITLEASSGEIRESIDLTAVITGTYELVVWPADTLYNTPVVAGKDNYFSIEINNRGSAAIDNIRLSADKPTGWTVKFSQDRLDSLAGSDYQTIDVNIKPPPRTIAGDYLITVRASGDQAVADKLEIRVTVSTPTVWGWVGVGIIVLVLAGLVFIFMRFSRR